MQINEKIIEIRVVINYASSPILTRFELSNMGRGLAKRAWWFVYITKTCHDPDLWWNIPVWKTLYRGRICRSLQIIRVDKPGIRVHRNADIIRYLHSTLKVDGEVPKVFCPVENKYRTPRYIIDDILREILREFIKSQNCFDGPPRVVYQPSSRYPGCGYCRCEGLHRKKVEHWIETMGKATGWWTVKKVFSSVGLNIVFDAHRFAKIRLRKLYGDRIVTTFMCCNRLGLNMPNDVKKLIITILVKL